MSGFQFFKVIVFAVVFGGLSLSSFAQPVTFSYTGAVQTYLVPKDVTGIIIDLQGAAGGSTDFSRGGYGGRVQCKLDVTQGNLLYIYVGGSGDNAAIYTVKGGYNGGGSGSSLAGGGGGASDIRMEGTSLSNRVVVAGGGGGGSTNNTCKDYDRGGNGGGLSGENGYYFSKNLIEHGGAGGTLVAGDILYAGNNGEGKPGNKGDGYDDDASFGGGGGGYDGGSGGGNGPYGGGGGGGSSYSDSKLTSAVIHTQGYNTERNGKIIITPVSQVVTVQN